MADESKNAAATEEFNDDGTKNPDYVAPKDASEGAADTENKGNTATGEEGEGEAFNDAIDPTKPPEIPVRKNIAQNIIARQSKTIEKLRSKTQTEDDGEDDSGANEAGESDDSQPSVAEEVNKTLSPLLNKLATDADEAELKDLFTTEPEAKKYENHIRAYMAHDTYKGVSPAVVFHHLAWAQAQSIGAKKRKAADLEANQSRNGGRTMADTSSADGLPSADDIANMSEADFAKMEEDVLQGKFKK